MRILILGLDNAGKTTILCIKIFMQSYIYLDKIHSGQVIQTVPSKQSLYQDYKLLNTYS